MNQLIRNDMDKRLRHYLQPHNKILIDWGYKEPRWWKEPDKKNEPGVKIWECGCNQKCWCYENYEPYVLQAVVKEDNKKYRMYEWIMYCSVFDDISFKCVTPEPEDYFDGVILQIIEGIFSRYRPIITFVNYINLPTEIVQFAQIEEMEYNEVISFLDYNDEVKKYANQEDDKEETYSKNIESKIFDTIPNQ